MLSPPRFNISHGNDRGELGAGEGDLVHRLGVRSHGLHVPASELDREPRRELLAQPLGSAARRFIEVDVRVKPGDVGGLSGHWASFGATRLAPWSDSAAATSAKSGGPGGMRLATSMNMRVAEPPAPAISSSSPPSAPKR